MTEVLTKLVQDWKDDMNSRDGIYRLYYRLPHQNGVTRIPEEWFESFHATHDQAALQHAEAELMPAIKRLHKGADHFWLMKIVRHVL